MKIRLYLLYFSLLTVGIQAQQKDSLYQKFLNDSTEIYRKKRITPYASLDFRNAYVGDRFLSFIGPLGGITLNSKHIIGLGFYFLNPVSIFRSNKIYTYSFDRINFLTAFYQYILFDGKRFDLLIPVEVGYGNYKALMDDGNTTAILESRIIPASAGIRGIYSFHRWLGFKLGAGYRVVLEKTNTSTLDGLYFSAGIKIDLLRLHQDFRLHRLKKQYRSAINKL